MRDTKIPFMFLLSITMLEKQSLEGGFAFHHIKDVFCDQKNFQLYRCYCLACYNNHIRSNNRQYTDVIYRLYNEFLQCR